MKKLIYTCSLALLIVVSGCTDLTDSAEDAIARKSAGSGGGTSVTDPAAALTGVYAQMNGFANQTDSPYALMEHPSDEMMGPTRGTDWSDFGVWRQLHLHTWDPSHSIVLNNWNLINSGVFKATQVIEASNASAQQVAEAKFLRGLFMFYVMDLYGQVPFRPVDAGPNDIPEVMSRPEAFQFIVDDLTSARSDLPTLTDGAGASRATQESVDFLLAKLYLNKPIYTTEDPSSGYPFQNFASEDMNEVISRVNNLIDNAYLNLDNYWENFYVNNTEESSELVFVLDNTSTDAPAAASNFYFMTLHYNQTPSGWNGFTTISEFYSIFEGDGEANDVRKNSEIPEVKDATGLDVGFLKGQQYGPDGEPLEDRGGNPLVFTEDVDLFYSNERQGIRAIKYPPRADNPSNTVTGADFIIARYADALLMKAEALLRGGTDTEKGQTALGIVNQIRQQRGADPLTSIDLQTLLDERGREMYWEGWRRNDQIRFGTFTNAWTGKEESDAFRILFPIPQKAMDTNPNFTQNSGY